MSSHLVVALGYEEESDAVISITKSLQRPIVMLLGANVVTVALELIDANGNITLAAGMVIPATANLIESLVLITALLPSVTTKRFEVRSGQPHFAPLPNFATVSAENIELQSVNADVVPIDKDVVNVLSAVNSKLPASKVHEVPK